MNALGVMILSLAGTHKILTFATYSLTIKATKSSLKATFAQRYLDLRHAIHTFHGNVEACRPGNQSQEQSELRGLRQPHHHLLVYGDTVQLASLGVCKAPAIWKSHNKEGGAGVVTSQFHSIRSKRWVMVGARVQRHKGLDGHQAGTAV